MSKFLKFFGLSRNPFVDRTAENSHLEENELYIPSDTQGFVPTDMTYIFFGSRGSGKTTIRRLMETAYLQHNSLCAMSPTAQLAGVARPYLVASVGGGGGGGALDHCLQAFQHSVGGGGRGGREWEERMCRSWSSQDFVDVVLVQVATELARQLSQGPVAGTQTKIAKGGGERYKAMLLEGLEGNYTAIMQILLLLHMYADVDPTSLRSLRATLQTLADQAQPRAHTQPQGTRSILSWVPALVAVTAAFVAVGLTTSGFRPPESTSDNKVAHKNVSKKKGAEWEADQNIEKVRKGIRGRQQFSYVLWAAAASILVTGTKWLLRQKQQIRRARRMQKRIRVLETSSSRLQSLRGVLDSRFGPETPAASLLHLYIGDTAAAKLHLLQKLVQQLGYASIIIIGDCFDESPLLSPTQYPRALKHFCLSLCQTSLLNFGHLHLFLPATRLQLDLSTDTVYKQARFDRHYVRELTWTASQLEELAERRFRGAQRKSATGGQEQQLGFKHIFRKIKAEDYYHAFSKIHTPRELMICMMEVINRIEGRRDDDDDASLAATADDLEMAVNKAKEQAS